MTSSPRLLYEQSVVHKGYLIIPYIYGSIAGTSVYAYRLLCEQGYQSRWHRTDNPAGLHSGQLASILEIAKEHLDAVVPNSQGTDYFQQRYVYRHNLVIISQVLGKFFYDHYPPERLHNIAAPKIFTSEGDCIAWVKAGLDRNSRKSTSTI